MQHALYTLGFICNTIVYTELIRAQITLPGLSIQTIAPSVEVNILLVFTLLGERLELKGKKCFSFIVKENQSRIFFLLVEINTACM